MPAVKVTITVPSELLSASKKRGPSFSGYVSSLIAADLARKDMLSYLEKLSTEAEVSPADTAWARGELVRTSKRLTRKAS